MKKLLVLLIAAILLGKMSVEEWQTFLQTKFLVSMVQAFCLQENCNKARVGAMTVGEEVLFFGECVDELDDKAISL